MKDWATSRGRPFLFQETHTVGVRELQSSTVCYCLAQISLQLTLICAAWRRRVEVEGASYLISPAFMRCCKPHGTVQSAQTVQNSTVTIWVYGDSACPAHPQ